MKIEIQSGDTNRKTVDGKSFEDITDHGLAYIAKRIIDKIECRRCGREIISEFILTATEELGDYEEEHEYQYRYCLALDGEGTEKRDFFFEGIQEAAIAERCRIRRKEAAIDE